MFDLVIFMPVFILALVLQAVGKKDKYLDTTTRPQFKRFETLFFDLPQDCNLGLSSVCFHSSHLLPPRPTTYNNKLWFTAILQPFVILEIFLMTLLKKFEDHFSSYYLSCDYGKPQNTTSQFLSVKGEGVSPQFRLFFIYSRQVYLLL